MPDPNTARLCRVAGRDAWHIYFRRRRISTGCTNRTEAERALREFVAGSSRPALTTLSVGSLLEVYLADRRDKGIPGADRLGFAHKQLCRHWKDKPPEVITDTECRAYARARAADGVAPATVRTELQALRAALKWAAGKKLIRDAPVVELPPRPPPRDRWLTREEGARLLEHCRAHHVRLFVSLALNTAARRGAILGLTWDRVDLKNRQINFHEPGRTKTRKGRARVPINDTLLEDLKAAHAAMTSSSVIEYGGGAVAAVKHGFRLACERAGLVGVTPHTLRHTAITWMMMAGVPIWEVAGIAGLSDMRQIDETYGHHTPGHLQKAASALG